MELGRSIANRRSRGVAVLVGYGLALVLAGCGGGGGGPGEEDSGGGSMNTTIDLRAAYDRLNQCGLTIDEASAVVGARPGNPVVYWDWYEDFFNDKDELRVHKALRLEGFPDDGNERAFRVEFKNASEGFLISKDLCD